METDSTFVDYNTIVNSQLIVHNDSIDESKDGLIFLIETGAPIISYYRTEKLTMPDIVMFNVDKNGNYFYEHIFKRICDAIDNITFVSSNKNPIVSVEKKLLDQTEPAVTMSFVIENKEYDYGEISTIPLLLLKYQEIKFKFTFLEKPKIDDEIQIRYKCYLFDNPVRKALLSQNIIDGKHKYVHGRLMLS